MIACHIASRGPPIRIASGRRLSSVDSGGIEVARTQERWDELQRRMTSATAWGVEAHLLTPEQVQELVPFISTDVILGGFYCPTVSVVDSLDTGTLFRNEAIEFGLVARTGNDAAAAGGYLQRERAADAAGGAGDPYYRLLGCAHD